LEKIYYSNVNGRKAGVATVVSDKIVLRAKGMPETERGIA
jgi:hypothetical protein